MEDDTKDWLSATKIDLLTYYSEAIDIHHIFPVAWCEKAENNIPRKDFDCIINKTPLSGRTNRIISGDAPSKYLSRIQKHAGVDNEDFIKILKSHVLEPVYMQTDDFYGFFNKRKEQILQRIEKAMNKQIPRDLIIEEGILIEEEIEEVTS